MPAVLPLVGLLLGGIPTAAQAAVDPNLKIDSVTLNKTSVAVSGLNTAAVTVTVKGVYDSSSPDDQKMTRGRFTQRRTRVRR